MAHSEQVFAAVSSVLLAVAQVQTLSAEEVGPLGWESRPANTAVNRDSSQIQLAPVEGYGSYYAAAADGDAWADPQPLAYVSQDRDADPADATADVATAPPEQPKPEKHKPAPAPYKGVYYDNDFSYLKDTPCCKWHLTDHLKQIPLARCFTLDVGGEYRLRHHKEDNFRGPGSALNGLSDEFLLQRTRLYGDLKVGQWARAYVEAIDATSAYEMFAARAIEENRFDALNLFGDLLLYDNCGGGKFWGRVGRQELLYGAERLISPLDWSNTRRTFDGAKLFWRGEDWNVDGFWTRPVPFGQHVGNDHEFDHPDQSQEFMGLYSSYKGRKDHTYDFYYLRLAEYDAPASAANPADFDANLFGARWLGKRCGWLWELEGGYQFGDFGAGDLSAGFFTVGTGREFVCARMKPTLWVYYDWASGDDDPNDADRNTFNQLFPLGHKYLGFMDLVGRQNVRAFNMLFTAQPTKKTKLLLWYYVFHLDDARDALYNAGGAPIRLSPAGVAGTDVGQEIDVTLQWNFHPRADVLFGYSHFYAGDFVKATNPAGVTGDADFYYGQFSFRF